MIIPFKTELAEHFYNKYNTILNKCYKEQQQQEEYNTITEYKKIQQEEKQKPIKTNNTNTFLAILIWILKISLCIVFFPIIFLLLILLAAIKNMK